MFHVAVFLFALCTQIVSDHDDDVYDKEIN